MGDQAAQGIVSPHRSSIFELGIFPALIDDVGDVDNVVVAKRVKIRVKEGGEDDGKGDTLDEGGELDVLGR